MTDIKMRFDPKVAKEVGTDAAIILSNIQFWCAKNKANQRHFYEGRYWTYNSAKSFAVLFDYLSTKQIRYCLKKLEEKGYIFTGNFNSSKYDRTMWYSCNIEVTNLSNGSYKSVTPIPDIKPDNKPNNKTNDRKVESFEKFWNIYGKKIGKKQALNQWEKLKDEDIKTIFSKLASWLKANPEEKYRPHPMRWIRDRRWDDETTIYDKNTKSKGINYL